MKILIFSFHKAYTSLLRDRVMFSETFEVIPTSRNDYSYNRNYDLMPLIYQVTTNIRGWMGGGGGKLLYLKFKNNL